MSAGMYRVDADKMRRARHEAMLTQIDLSTESGVSLSTIKRIEEGHRWEYGLRGATVKLLAKALEVSPKFLVSEIVEWSWQGYPQSEFRGRLSAQSGVKEGVDDGVTEGVNGDSHARVEELKALDLGVDLGVQPLSTEDSKTNTLARRKVGRVEPDGFAEWYAVYPIHLGRADAAKAYAACLRSVPASELLEGAQRFRDDPNLPADKSKIPYPATWLRAGRWMDDPLPARSNGHVSEIEKFLASEGIDRG